MATKLISSRDNAFYKELKLLSSSSQARRKEGRTLLDGIRLCDTYLQQIGLPLQCVVGETATRNAEVASILSRCEAQNGQIVVFPDSLFELLSQVENGIDILFLIETPQLQQPARLTRAAVLLDRVQDPGNFGSIVRSAAASGIEQIFCSAGTTFAWSPKVMRAGMGAHFQLQIFEHVDLAALLARTDIPVVATSSHASQRLYDLDLTEPVAWLFGHEGQGVADNLLTMATHRVAIPHLGAVESLNVAASAAVCFFEQVRQRVVR